MIQFYDSIIYFNYNSGKENDYKEKETKKEKIEDGEEENDQGDEADDQVR